MTIERIPTPAIASGANEAMLKVEPDILSVLLRTSFQESGRLVIEVAAPEKLPAMRMMM